MISPDELIAEARTWLGTPFRHQGRNRCGVDCAGFLVAIVRAAGELPAGYTEPKAYSRRPNGELYEIVARHCTRTNVAARGVLVLVRWPRDPEPRHVALCTGDTLIHSYQDARGVVENGYRGAWLRNTHSLWNIPGVIYV